MNIITLPFSWLLLKFYELTGSYGVAVILFALAVKLILLPFQMKSKRSSLRTMRLAPLMKELEKKHEGNQKRYQEEVARLYKEEKINPMSGCLWTLIPFPILIALYSVIRQPFTKLMGLTAENVTEITNRLVNMGLYTIPEKTDAYYEITLANLVHDHFPKFQDISEKLVNLDFHFLGLNLGNQPNLTFFTKVDWSESASWAPALGLFLLPFVSGALSYLAYKASMVGNPSAQAQQDSMKGMALIMPLMSVYIGFIMPAALCIYWIVGSLLGMLQDVILNKHYKKILDAEDAERRERMRLRDEELKRKRQETERLRELGATERNKNTSKKKIQAAQKNENELRLAAEKAQEKARRREALGLSNDTPASQVGNRRFARGRAYVEDRFTNPENAFEATEAAAAASEIDAQVDSEYENQELAQETVTTSETVNEENSAQ